MCIIYDIIKDEVKKEYSDEKWSEHEYRLMQLFKELEPSKPEDQTSGFIAYNVSDKPRMKIKTGRFLTRKLQLNSGFLPDNIIQKIAEKINLTLFEDNLSVQLVRGEKITQVYQNSVGSGSCMTGGCADYTLLYEMNPDKFQMLIMQELNNSARAIVHKLDNGEFYLDRVYSDSEILKDKMREYAINHNWHYRNFNKCPSCQNSILKVSGLDYEDGHIPYMDTMIYGSFRNGKLDISAYSGEFSLQSTNGYVESMRCENCENYVNEDDVYYVDDYSYCERCYCENFCGCDYCGATVSIEDIICIEEHCYCERCANNHAWQCADCNTWFLTSSNSYDVNGDSICENCIDNYNFCEDCGEYHTDNSYFIEDKEIYVCENCIENYNQCPECEKYFDYEFKNKKCDDCQECVGQMVLPLLGEKTE